MAGIKALRKIQLGRESSVGVEVDTTTIWRGKGTLEDLIEVKFAEEDVGYLSGVDRTYVPKTGGKLSMDAVEATYEQLLHILEAGIKTATPAKDGAGSGYAYTYTFPTIAQPTIKTYTIEGGDNQQEEQMLYCFVEAFKLSGKPGQSWMMSAEWKGKQVAPGTFTAALTVPTVEEILFGKTKLYIDAAGGTMGTTQKSNTLLGADLDVKTGNIAVETADGNLDFSYIKTVSPEVLLKITFEHEATAVAEIAAARAQTARLLCLKVLGSGLTTPAAYTNKLFQIGLAGKWEKFEKLGEQNGNDVVTGTFRARYNATASKFAEILVVNELTAVP